MKKPKIAIIFTGGTIAMKASQQKGGAVPALKGKDLIAQVPGIPKIAAVTVHDFGQYPGPHMTPELMLELSQLVKKYLAQKETAGVIITHGTDTLEETAFFLDLCLNSQKPV
ncbi:MAG: asparaginase domain-containing protein, partial [bacterium]|nr:asparaginase domain-containing protein [bacterium]